MEEIPSSTPQSLPPPQTATTTSSSLLPPTTTSSFLNPPSQKQESSDSQTKLPLDTQPPPHSDSSLPSPPLMHASPASTASSIGVRDHIPSTAPPPPASFSSLERSQPIQGTETLGATSSMLRPAHSSLGPQSSSRSQSPATQSFQGHGMFRVTCQSPKPDTSPQSIFHHVPSTNKVLGKRRIQDVVNKIYPSGKLDPEIEDVILKMADEFLKTVLRIGCLLAKHRNSSTIEAEDILLALEIKWNTRLAGLGGDEIRASEEAVTVNENHTERIAAVKESVLASDNYSSEQPATSKS